MKDWLSGGPREQKLESTVYTSSDIPIIYNIELYILTKRRFYASITIATSGF